MMPSASLFLLFQYFIPEMFGRLRNNSYFCNLNNRKAKYHNMTADLTFTSDPIEVRITNYVKHTFRYNDWVISDKYVPHEGNPCFCKYSILVTKNGIADEEMLHKYRVEGLEVVNLITSLIPLCGLPSLNSPKYQDFNKGTFVIDYKDSPQGWKTNYIEVKDIFEAAM